MTTTERILGGQPRLHHGHLFVKLQSQVRKRVERRPVTIVRATTPGPGVVVDFDDVDVRRIDLLGPIMAARLRTCREKGFDAVEPDNIDGYTNDTGFPITYEDQLRYNRWLASEAHALGLSIGLKNDPGQVVDLVSDFDWALTEDCFDQGWCGSLSPFLAWVRSGFGNPTRRDKASGFTLPLLSDMTVRSYQLGVVITLH